MSVADDIVSLSREDRRAMRLWGADGVGRDLLSACRSLTTSRSLTPRRMIRAVPCRRPIAQKHSVLHALSGSSNRGARDGEACSRVVSLSRVKPFENIRKISPFLSPSPVIGAPPVFGSNRLH